MELFKNASLKDMYESFTQKTIFKIFDCQYCNQKCCRKHYRFDCSCNQCREMRCYNCHKFNVELDALLTSCSEQARLYILNYVRDFFRVSSISLDFFFNFQKPFDIDAEKLQSIIWNLRLYHSSKKGRHVEHQLDITNYADYVYTIDGKTFTFKS